jgi:hypothetical protein
VAETFGIALLDDGIPEIREGLDSLDALGALFRLGWSACPLISLEAIDGRRTTPRHLPSDEIKEAIKGHREIIGYNDSDPNVSEHSLAWDGENAIAPTAQSLAYRVLRYMAL